MSVPPEKISELKQIIHGQLSQVKLTLHDVNTGVKTCWCLPNAYEDNFGFRDFFRSRSLHFLNNKCNWKDCFHLTVIEEKKHLSLFRVLKLNALYLISDHGDVKKCTYSHVLIQMWLDFIYVLLFFWKSRRRRCSHVMLHICLWLNCTCVTNFSKRNFHVRILCLYLHKHFCNSRKYIDRPFKNKIGEF